MKATHLMTVHYQQPRLYTKMSIQRSLDFCILFCCMCIWMWVLDALELELDRCELPCGCWDLNLGPLEEPTVLLTTEPTL